VLAGIKLLNNVIVFNLENQIYLGDLQQVELRIAGHFGAVAFKIPISNIVSPHLNRVVKIMEEATAKTFLVTKFLRDKVNDCLKRVLSLERKMQQIYVYTYRISLPKELDLENEWGDIFDEFIKFAHSLIEKIRQHIINENEPLDIENIRIIVDNIYRNVERFISDYFESSNESDLLNCPEILAKYSKALLEEDEILAKNLNELYFIDSKNVKSISGLTDIIHFVNLRKLGIIPEFKVHLKRLLTSNELEIELKPSPSKEFIQKVENFINADVFEEEIAFAELFFSDREELLNFILHESGNERSCKFINRLWKMSDLVLIEDLSIKQELHRVKAKFIFPVLSSDTRMGSYFSTTLSLLRDDLDTDIKRSILGQFEKYGLRPRSEDIVVVLKCLLIGVDSREVRRGIIKNIDFRELWGIIAYSETPLEVLMEIASFLYHEKDKDRMMIFFDLTWSKFRKTLTMVNEEIILHRILFIIRLFYHFDFFVEDGYFERLEELRLIFIEVSKKYPEADLTIDKKLFETLKERREKVGELPPSIPKYLEDLPLPIKRKLAREGHYIIFFISSTHNQIALETFKHITEKKIVNVLAYRSINHVLFERLLKNKSLFTRKSTILLALFNPKCNVTFFDTFSSCLSEWDLINIASNPNTNPDVRNRSKSELRKIKRKRSINKRVT
jgi:hypothetical protein